MTLFDSDPNLDKEEDTWGQWEPRKYLDTFFNKLGPDSLLTLDFINKHLRTYEKNPVNKLIDFGSGPSALMALAASRYTNEFHCADVLSSNLAELAKWINKDPTAFNWESATREILKIEGLKPTVSNIRSRIRETRSKIKLLFCDANQEHPLGQSDKYPIGLAIFCADSATNDFTTWNSFMNNILNIIAARGEILIAALRKCSYYKFGDETYPSANIDEKDIETLLLQRKFKVDDLKVFPVVDCVDNGFSSIILAKGTKTSDL